MFTDTFFGMPLPYHDDATRYIVYKVGTRSIIYINWTARIIDVQRRSVGGHRRSTRPVSMIIMPPDVLFRAAEVDLLAYKNTFVTFKNIFSDITVPESTLLSPR